MTMKNAVARLVFTILALVAGLPVSALAQASFTVGPVTAPPGTMASGELTIAALRGEPGTTIPFTIVNGAKPGPVLVLTAGVHGAEYPPILALQRLRTSIDPKDLAGTVIMVHVANMPSYLKHTIYYSPVDGKNLNRLFPGKADGTISERIADALTREVIDRADALVDLHCGDANESLRPYVYWETIGAPPDLAARGREMALAFGIDHIVLDRERPTDAKAALYLSNTAITRGKPAFSIESGGLGASDEESVGRIERGVAGLMRYLKMRSTGPGPVEHPIWLDPAVVLNSPATGIFYPAVERGYTVAKDTLVGHVTDFFGKTLAEIHAPFAGEVLYVIGTPAISQGEPVAFIGARLEK
jgi:predicted deacylase